MSLPGAPLITLLNTLPGTGTNGVLPDLPDLPDGAGFGDASSGQNGQASGRGIADFTGLVKAFQNTTPALEKAQQADASFANGSGDLMGMMLQRKIADTYLQIDEAFSSKAVQAITTLMNMQV